MKKYTLNTRGKVIFSALGITFALIGIYANIVLWAAVLGY